jgi:hypothetical protein
MTSKRRQRQVKTAQRRTQRVQQLMLDLDRARKADSQKKRKSETHELCVAGGQMKGTALWTLPPLTRLGALYLAADRLSEPGYLAACEARGILEEAASLSRKKAKAGSQDQREKKQEKSADKGSVASSPHVSDRLAAITPLQIGKEGLVVRFHGPIKGGLGDRLRALGLEYKRDKQEWRGEVFRSAVETEIAGSVSRKLVKSIEAAPLADAVVGARKAEIEDEVTVEYCEEVKLPEPERTEELGPRNPRRKSGPTGR